MTRREEIEKTANEFYKGDEVSTFVVAAQWADKTMIDKACKWLKKWTYQDCLGVSPMAKLKVGFSSVEELVDAFKQAMEE